ncbi:Iron permease FTR1 family protein [Saccharomyces cerevisiae]|nr:Iron permease FTR1 family protein [Saccharomyces cerevisiae]
MAFEDYFSFQIFFIFLRESLEIVVIVSILLTIVKQGLSVEDDSPFEGSSSSAGLPSPNTNTNADSTTAFLQAGPSDGNAIGTSATAANNKSRPLNVEEEEEIYEYSNELRDQDRESDEHTADNVKLYQKLKIQILAGGAFGLLLCVLSLVASVIISVMGLFFLRMGKLREKFRVKLASIIYSKDNNLLGNKTQKGVKFSEKYSFFILPFITTLREGLEAVVFIGGIGIDQPLSSIPLSMVLATAISTVFGIFFFRYSSSLSLKICLVVATCFLYLIAAGLFSKGVWQLELQDYVNKCNGQDMSEVGNGPGSYDISRSVWHVNCCNGEKDGGWMIFTAIFGWTNSATVGSVISYNAYWLVLICALKLLMIEEKYGYIHIYLSAGKRNVL